MHGGDDVERKFEPVGFFGIDGEADAVLLRQLRQFEQLRRQFGMHARALGDFVARMQCRELDRDARRIEHVGERSARAERGDRVLVRLEIALAVGRGQRAFAEHVVGIAVGAVFLFVRAVERFLDRAAHDELMAHDAHRLAHRETDHRFARAADQALERAGEIALGFIGQIDQFAGQHQTPGARVDEQRIALAQMRFPVRLAELVGDELVGRGLVRNAQQRFGHAHQQHAFLARQIVLAHERFDRRLLVRLGAHARDEFAGARQHQIALCGGQCGLVEQLVDRFRFRRGNTRRSCAPARHRLRGEVRG